jgi:hypothetical protein
MTPSDPPDYQKGTGIENDRRTNIYLRSIFENACRITAPFFDCKQGWGEAHLTLFAHQALREAYPELTLQDIALLFSGVQSHHLSTSKKLRVEN